MENSEAWPTRARRTDPIQTLLPRRSKRVQQSTFATGASSRENSTQRHRPRLLRHAASCLLPRRTLFSLTGTAKRRRSGHHPPRLGMTRPEHLSHLEWPRFPHHSLLWVRWGQATCTSRHRRIPITDSLLRSIIRRQLGTRARRHRLDLITDTLNRHRLTLSTTLIVLP